MALQVQALARKIRPTEWKPSAIEVETEEDAKKKEGQEVKAAPAPSVTEETTQLRTQLRAVNKANLKVRSPRARERSTVQGRGGLTTPCSHAGPQAGRVREG